MDRHDRGRTSSQRAHGARKTMQLCKQVQRVVASVLAECADGHVSQLSLLGVEPAAGSSVLRVAVVAMGADGEALAATRAALEQLKPYLRMEVADAICRKRVPELVFSVVPA
ncbi:MAG: ribosome-binding factor A [Deltaproteobacteria bacterium]|nr:ribosome-binding factor A [Deltaproteobacteria bacterium]